MPPRKPKQPARRKAATKKAAPRKTQSKAATTRATTPSGEEYNPQTHILCDDGKVYERRIVSGTGAAVGVNQTVKTDAHLDLERKMAAAIHQAHSEGVTDAEELRNRIMAAREDHLDNG